MIVVEWQDEHGRCVKSYSGPPPSARLCEMAALSSACLRFIVPYADVTFNYAQVEVLEMELAEIIRTAKNANVVQQAQSLLDFIGQVADRVHMYLKFKGD